MADGPQRLDAVDRSDQGGRQDRGLQPLGRRPDRDRERPQLHRPASLRHLHRRQRPVLGREGRAQDRALGRRPCRRARRRGPADPAALRAHPAAVLLRRDGDRRAQRRDRRRRRRHHRHADGTHDRAGDVPLRLHPLLRGHHRRRLRGAHRPGIRGDDRGSVDAAHRDPRQHAPADRRPAVHPRRRAQAAPAVDHRDHHGGRHARRAHRQRLRGAVHEDRHRRLARRQGRRGVQLCRRRLRHLGRHSQRSARIRRGPRTTGRWRDSCGERRSRSRQRRHRSPAIRAGSTSTSSSCRSSAASPSWRGSSSTSGSTSSSGTTASSPATPGCSPSSACRSRCSSACS